MKIFKRISFTLIGIIIVLLVAIGCYVGYMQAHSYRIPDNQKLAIGNNQAAKRDSRNGLF